MLRGKNITLYVTGSIAAYKSVVLLRLLIKAGANVQVVLTAAAAQLVTPLTFEKLSKRRVFTDIFNQDMPEQVDHVAIADWTDLAIVAPASAQIIAQMANGLANDLAPLTLLATTAPKIVVPAMNEHMWQNVATQRNLAQLTDDGIKVMQPDHGFLAEGYDGHGRFPEPEAILAFVDAHDAPIGESQPLAGKRVVVTAGGTRERIDPVRFIGNDSSGKMGYALAQQALKLGADVTLISGPTKLTAPVGINLISVFSTEDLADAVKAAFETADILVMAAAVADFRPTTTADQKIKKTKDNDQMTITLEKTPDILKTIQPLKTHQFVVGFAAETQNLIQNATKKMTEKGLNLLVANDVSKAGIGFNGDDNQVTILSPDADPVVTEVLPKTQIATLILQQVTNRMK